MAETFYSKKKAGTNGPFSFGASSRVDGVNDVQWNSLKAMMLNFRTFCPKKALCCCLKLDKT